MTLQIHNICDNTYILNYENEPSYILNYENEYEHISECTDGSCIYARKNTKIRELFEKKIHQFVGTNRNIKILFYSSFKLAQELRILALLQNKISEIHLTDFAYADIAKNTEFIKTFVQFMQYIHSNKLEIKVYLHTDPEKLITNQLFARRFDIICGIDIDYTKNKTNNQQIMENIAKNTLKIDGRLYISQHYIDLVDLRHYEIGDDGDMKLVNIDDYVKPPYYAKYFIEFFFMKIRYPMILLLFIITLFNLRNITFLTIIAINYFLLSLLVTSNIVNYVGIYNRRIKNLLDIRN